MTSPTVLAATWSDGLFVRTGDASHQELPDQPVRSLAPDGNGGALAIVGGRSLRRRTAEGTWNTVATAESELSCCVAVVDAVYVGTDDACVLRVGANGIFERLAGFDAVAGRDQWYAGTALIDGRVVGPPLGVLVSVPTKRPIFKARTTAGRSHRRPRTTRRRAAMTPRAEARGA